MGGAVAVAAVGSGGRGGGGGLERKWERAGSLDSHRLLGVPTLDQHSSRSDQAASVESAEAPTASASAPAPAPAVTGPISREHSLDAAGAALWPVPGAAAPAPTSAASLSLSATGSAASANGQPIPWCRSSRSPRALVGGPGRGGL